MADQLGPGLKVALTDLYLSAPAFGRAGGEIGAAVAGTQRLLDGLGNFWGDDAPGQKFGSFYSKDQAQLLYLLGIVAAQVEGIRDGINQMADRYGIAEQRNIGKIMALENEEP